MLDSEIEVMCRELNVDKYFTGHPEGFSYWMLSHRKDSALYKFFRLLPVGKENAVSMPTVAGALGMYERAVRDLVLSARLHGFIVADDTYGYYYPANIEELQSYCNTGQLGTDTTQKCIEPALRYLEKREKQNHE